MIDQESERRLIEGLLRDDSESVASLYDRDGAAAYGLAFRVLGESNAAEDVVQESFVALWRQAERLDPARGVRSYLLTIVHNKAIDRLRQKGRRAELALDPALPVPASSEDPLESAERGSERESVRAALGSLPPEQRQAVEMTYFGGLTINEAAARMNIPVGTVKSRLRLALTRLRRELAGAQ